MDSSSFLGTLCIRTSQMMTSRSLIYLLENQNGGKLQNSILNKTSLEARIQD
jgi:hypothetical protein